MAQRENSVSVSVPLTPTRSDLYWRRIFNKYDHDNDGRISYTELKGIIESREYEHDIPDAVVDKIMALSDRDRSGYLDFAEFVEMIVTRGAGVPQLYDHDNDGRISYTELKGIIESREYEHDIPDAVVDKIMALSDRDRSGYLDFAEFVEMMHRPELKAVFGHFVARYVHCLVAPRSPVDTTGKWAASFGPVATDENARTRTRSTTLFTYTDGRYEEQYSCWPPAICMVLVSLAEIATYCVDAAVGRTDARGPVAIVLIYNPARRYEAWRFLSYMFVHVGPVHLLVNLLVQLFLGVPLEMVHRWWRVVLVYVAGVVAGSLATSLTDPHVFLAGASGGVYALITAHVATIIMNWKQMDFAIVQMLVFLLLAGVDIGTAVYNRYFLNVQENIGYVAHLAGALAGLLVGIGVLRNLEVNSWEKRMWWGAVTLYILLMISAVLANIFWTSRFLR